MRFSLSLLGLGILVGGCSSSSSVRGEPPGSSGGAGGTAGSATSGQTGVGESGEGGAPIGPGDAGEGGATAGTGGAGPEEAGGAGGETVVGGAAGMDGGAGGDDPCEAVICESPPANGCTTDAEFVAYDPVGTCAAGVCSYESNSVDCTCVADECTTDPCMDVVCASPPATTCANTTTLRTYAASGTCTGGSCSYTPTDTACTFGCAAGACAANPCMGVVCNSPPAATCSNTTTLRTYAATGTCNGGTCNYAATNTICAAGCSSNACVSDTWFELSASNRPGSRTGHKAVWTGSEMIVWGGGVSAPLIALGDGARYSSTRAEPDKWIPLTATGAPAARTAHVAVWAGTQMIVWGGNTAGLSGSTAWLNTGGRYSVSGGWTATSTTGAPAVRSHHTAVWTGTEMIVWGGQNGTSPLGTGGRYNPSTNTWTEVSTFSAPTARTGHVAVWTGSVMLIWGGTSTLGANPTPLNTGSRYNPTTNTWTAITTTNAPSARNYHTAVWTGTEMIVWGGNATTSSTQQPLDTGSRYNPATNAWTTMSTTGAPGPRWAHSAVWNGTQMIIWAGIEAGGNTDTGGVTTRSPTRGT